MPSNIIFVEIKWSVISARPPPPGEDCIDCGIQTLSGVASDNPGD